MISIMQQRMAMYKNIRYYFEKQKVSEVETNILSKYGTTDTYIDSFNTFNLKYKKYMQTSPEFAMKQLLADGFGDIFQICKVFRNEETGSLHSPEFVMLEWYRIGFDLFELMSDVTDLVKSLANKFLNLEVEYLQYLDIFQDIGINPHQDEFAKISQKANLLIKNIPQLTDKDELLDFILVTILEKNLGQNKLTFLYNYPASKASLAKIDKDKFGNVVSRRFELYYQGIELANGFEELTDAKEQKQRFIDEINTRKQHYKEEIPYDENLIKSLEKGMPECSGVALGLDRLLMLILGEKNIKNIIFGE